MNATLRILVAFVLGLAVAYTVLSKLKTPSDEFVLVEESDQTAATRSPTPRGPDWGRIVVRASTGRRALPENGVSSTDELPDDSGGPPTPREPSANEPGDNGINAPPTETSDDEPIGEPVGDSLPDLELLVPPGATLSEIAAEHYGTAAPALVAALAAYNGLTSPDALRSGTRLKLPSRERLDR